MRSFALVSGLATLILALSARATLDKNLDTVRLSPIKLSDWEAATGIHRRASNDYSHLEPNDKARLIFGRPGKNGKFLLADMNLYASNGLNIVMMEKFEGLTKSVDCKGDDGTMSLTFKSENAFKYALKTWNFINEAKEKKFLLIANHDGCGPDDERQPYIINNIREDKTTLTTFLEAQKAPWSEIADTYDLDFGHIFRKPGATRSLKHRGLLGDIGGALLGNFDITKSATFNIAVGHQGERTNIYTAENGHIKLDCIDCFVTGNFLVTGHLAVKSFKLQDLTLEASPQGVLAKLELEATLTATDSPEALNYEKELFAFGIPDAGIAVTGIFSLGATLKYDIGVSTTFKGQGIFDFGLQTGLADTAKLTADVSNPDASSAIGFDGVSVTPIFDVKSLSASVTVAAYSQPKLSFGIDITKIGHLDVAINVELPKVSATLTAEFDPNGVCSPGSSKTGIKLDSELDVEVDLALEAGLGDSSKKPFNKKLFGITKPLFSTCFPLDIPGFGGQSSSTVEVPSSVTSSVQAISTLPSSVIPTASVPVVTPIVTPTTLSTSANLPSRSSPKGSNLFPTGSVATPVSSRSPVVSGRPGPSGSLSRSGKITLSSTRAPSGRPVPFPSGGIPVPSGALRFRRSQLNPPYEIRV